MWSSWWLLRCTDSSAQLYRRWATDGNESEEPLLENGLPRDQLGQICEWQLSLATQHKPILERAITHPAAATPPWITLFIWQHYGPLSERDSGGGKASKMSNTPRVFAAAAYSTASWNSLWKKSILSSHRGGSNFLSASPQDDYGRQEGSKRYSEMGHMGIWILCKASLLEKIHHVGQRNFAL